MLLAGFDPFRVEVAGGVELVGRLAGSGPPVLLLHGYPETHVQWHAVAPALAERFTVVCPDLRGHGDSSKPAGGPAAYARRVHCADQIALMRSLGFERFALVGHDRGARVAYRFAVDHPERIERLCLLDAAPTQLVVDHLTHESAMAQYHWLFLTQPAPLPETLLAGAPAFFVRWCLRSWSGGVDDFFHPEAVAEYERCLAEPDTIRATCDDIRALFGEDLRLEREDLALGRRIRCPLLVLWGSRGRPDADLLPAWRERADHVEGHALDCGHFLMEERPAETLAALEAFLAG
ncbi:MAG: alpha/beta hydrolase [Thermoleophilia bacterium]